MKIKVIKDFAYKGKTLDYLKTKKVADILEQSQLLEKECIQIRKKYKIPSEGYPIVGKVDLLIFFKLIDKLKDNRDDFFDDCQQLLKKLELPQYWDFQIVILVLTSVLLPPDETGLFVISTKSISKPDEMMQEYDWGEGSLSGYVQKLSEEKALLLSIRRKMSKTELLKLIDKNWNEIQLRMTELPKLPTHKMARIGLIQEIVTMRESEKKKHAEIADILAEKYEDDLSLYDLLTEEYVKNLYNRWKSKSKSIS
ncbi:MAG: hypothetical protein ABIJ33_00675 [Patescibacteria group bacterium]